MPKKGGVFIVKPVDSKDGHKRTSSQYLTFVDPTTCATGCYYSAIKNILEFWKIFLNDYCY
jgi:hypothetical protein